MTMRNGLQQSPKRLIPAIAALTLLLLWAAESVGLFALLFLFPLALVGVPLSEERLLGWLIAIDVSAAVIVLFLPVPHYVWLAFVCMLAPFVPLRRAFSGLKRSSVASLLCVGVIAAFSALVLVLLTQIGVRPLSAFSPIVTVFFALGGLFFLFLLDAAFQLSVRLYRNRLRRFLLPRA